MRQWASTAFSKTFFSASIIIRQRAGFRGAAGYEPPHSKGPGDKAYKLHGFALSADPEIAGPADRVNCEALIAAMEGKIMGRADLSVVYNRDAR